MFLDIFLKKGYELFEYFFIVFSEKYFYLVWLLESGVSEDGYNNVLYEGIDLFL